MRILELYSGIGGLAEAVAGRGEIVLAIDQSPLAVLAYKANFDHPVAEKRLETIGDNELAELDAALWWASPPCQPFTAKGRRRFLDDARSATYLELLRKLERLRPPHFVLENVPGFAVSPGRELLLQTLDSAGYRHVREVDLCPTQLGIPMQRRRYFVLASRHALREAALKPNAVKPLESYIEVKTPRRFDVDQDTLRRYRYVMDFVDPARAGAVAACFGSGYGRSVSRTGSYIATRDGRIRRFTPREMLRLMGFAEAYVLPASLTDRQAWRLIGNSLSVDCVRQVLAALPAFRSPAVQADRAAER